MPTLRAHLRSLSMLALVAMLALALLPTVSHALSFAKGDARSLAEICTPQGMRIAQVDSASSEGGAPAVSGGMDCPYCSLGGHLSALPPAAPQLLPVAPAESIVPALFLQAPRTLFAWASAQPRAPPTTC